MFGYGLDAIAIIATIGIKNINILAMAIKKIYKRRA
jgi:hypothetical protein